MRYLTSPLRLYACQAFSAAVLDTALQLLLVSHHTPSPCPGRSKRFWVCPNGGKNCQYRHALPPGYVLKSQMKQLMEEEMANKKSVEEEIEEERQKVWAFFPAVACMHGCFLLAAPSPNATI